jgi:trk system potassium uptake protein TrkA
MTAGKRYLVIGLGRFGQALAEELSAQGAEVFACDMNMANVEAVKDRVAMAAQLDASDPEALRGIDAAVAQAAIVAIGENFEATVLCVAALKEVGVTRVIARARTAMQARILVAVGASQVIELESEMGRRLGQTLAHTDDTGVSTTRAFGVSGRK